MFRQIARAFCPLFAFCGSIFFTQLANGVAPTFVTDRELAESKAIVVAKWNHAPWKSMTISRDGKNGQDVHSTEIEVTRVIKGPIKPGRHRISVAFGIGWSKEYPGVMSYTSSEARGDADASEENLWFLNFQPFKDGHNGIWCLDTYRGVQPIDLEPLFNALQQGDIESQIPILLRSNVQLVALRTLECVSGGNPPWPFVPDPTMRSAENGELLRSHVDQVSLLVDESNDAVIRRMATAVYAHLMDEGAVPHMQASLKDKDPVVRAIALGIITRYRSTIPTESLAQIVQGLTSEPQIIFELIEKLKVNGDAAVVPALIEFLQNDRFCGFCGNELDVPAFQARKALYEITHCWFPYNVSQSRNAWAKATTLLDPNERTKYLNEVLSDDQLPWQATVVTGDGRAFIEITNRSKLRRSLTTRPLSVTLVHSGGFVGARCEDKLTLDEQGFVFIEPGASHRFGFPDKFMKKLTSVDKREPYTVRLGYASLGKDFNINPWLGIVEVNASAIAFPP